LDEGDEEGDFDARLSVTQSCDPLSGGHFGVGASNAPPRSARERSGVVVEVVAFHMADSDYARRDVSVSPIRHNGLTSVGGAHTKFLFRRIGSY